MKEIVQWCLELGISCVSVYAFSIDNFRRPQEEVDALMELAAAKFEELLHVSKSTAGYTGPLLHIQLHLQPQPQQQVVWGVRVLGGDCISTCNGRRPQEVDALMELAAAKFEELLHVSSHRWIYWAVVEWYNFTCNRSRSSRWFLW
jgi:undecaprenyl pyrophosphate synthase